MTFNQRNHYCSSFYKNCYQHQYQITAQLAIINSKNLSMKCQLKWSNLTLAHIKTNKTILKNMNGVVKSGQFLSIMGPSGAGKSSLLSLLTCRISNGSTYRVDGRITVNDHQYSLQQFSAMAAYVEQVDLLFGTFTVGESFKFQADLRLWNKTPLERQAICQALLKKLNLYDHTDTIIGTNQHKKTISGGQKRRLTIGLELLSEPQILILDEPTSGLDSHNALVIIKLLNQLASQGKLIISTIHQPSSLIFKSLDLLSLLVGGEDVYWGQVSGIIGYLEEIGVAVDYRMNPADFIISEVSKRRDLNQITLFNSQNFRNHRLKQQLEQPIQTVNPERSQLELSQLAIKQTPLLMQVGPLLLRAWISLIRNPSNQLNKLVSSVFVPVLLGLMYINMSHDPPTDPFDPLFQSKLIDLSAFLFISIYFTFGFPPYEACMIFPVEKDIVFKDARSGIYSVGVYFVTRFAVELIGCFFQAVGGCCILYLMAGLEPEYLPFTAFVFLIASIVGHLFGLTIGVMCKDDKIAVTALPLVLIPLLIFGGLVVNIDTIPSYVRWVQYISPMRHGFIIIFKEQMKTQTWSHYREINAPQFLGIDKDEGLAFWLLVAMIPAYLIICLGLLWIMKKRL